MNVLIVVFTMLSLLTIMTYTRLQTFLDSAGIRIEYEKYMTETERSSIDSLEDRKYRTTTVKATAGGPKPGKAAEEVADKEASLAKLNLMPLMKNEVTADETDLKRVTGPLGSSALILERLMDILYGDQRFYKEALKDYPDLPQALIYNVVQGAKSKSPCDLKFTHVRDLANITLSDPKLREVWYKMLKGQEPSYRSDSKGKKVKTSSGYSPLTEYVALRKKSTAIRVWLARKALIEAIFRDPETILSRRQELYGYVKDGMMTEKGANQEFAAFKEGTDTDIDLSLLDFNVSKSRPPTN